MGKLPNESLESFMKREQPLHTKVEYGTLYSSGKTLNKAQPRINCNKGYLVPLEAKYYVK